MSVPIVSVGTNTQPHEITHLVTEGGGASAGGEQRGPHQLVVGRDVRISWWWAEGAASAGGELRCPHQLVVGRGVRIIWW